MRKFLLIFVGILLITTSVFAQEKAKIQSPADFFGFEPGSDRNLFDYESLINYLKTIDEASPNFKMIPVGESPLGRTMYLCFLSSEDNINKLDSLREINRRLALDYDIPDAERERLISEGKVFVMATLSMHSTEVSPAQALPTIVYELVTSKDLKVQEWLDNVVVMWVPNHNPDGMDMVVENYKKYKGTKYEGSSLPGVYHKYVGHDNNRDFITLTQKDTKIIARIFDREWYPQVLVEKHQMGSTGPRFFVPPNHDPIAQNIDEWLWNWSKTFGANLVRDMTRDGCLGVVHGWLFDDYWPGSTETSLWSNVISFLTEAASCDVASPVYIEPTELNVRGKGLSEYKKGINMVAPWPGGWWRLSDLVKYELSSTLSIINTAALYKKDILTFRNDICKKNVEIGRTTPPYYYILPVQQHDTGEFIKLINLLKEHGIYVYKLTAPVTIKGLTYDKGDIVVPLAQPYRSLVKEVLEKQEFPLRHYTPDGEPIRPYDITSWSLPIHLGVKAIEVDERSTGLESLLEEIKGTYSLPGKNKELPQEYYALVYPVTNTESFKAAFLALTLGLKVDRANEDISLEGEKVPTGSFLIYFDKSKENKLKRIYEEIKIIPIVLKDKIGIHTTVVNNPRVALVETWFHDMDAGWTRFIFDEYFVDYKVVRPGDFEKTDFVKNFDIVIFPSNGKDILMTGSYEREGEYYIPQYPPEYTKGIGKKGMENLMKFVDAGGIIVAWGESAELLAGTLEITRGKEVEKFQLPIRDITKNLKKSGLFVPGAMIKIKLIKDHPLTYGMPCSVGAFLQNEFYFTTHPPSFDMDRKVIAWHPEEKLLISGYIEKEELLYNRPAMAWIKKGIGQFVILDFCPQFRASTAVTYKLLFNSILLKKLK